MLSCNQYFDAQFEVLEKFLEYIRIVQKIKSLRMANSFHHANQRPLEQLKVFQNAELMQTELEQYLEYIYSGIDLTGDDSDGPINKVIHLKMNFSGQLG